MKPAIWILGRFIIFFSFAVGLGTFINRQHHNSYWNGTIYRVQTVDFNLLSHTLPTKLSYAIPLNNIEEIQRTLNSTYGLFGLAVTNCRTTLPECPDQEILYTTDSTYRWYQKLDQKGTDYLIETNAPYDVLRYPPPLLTEGGYDHSRDEDWNESTVDNPGQIVGRVYYIRGVPPLFWEAYSDWLKQMPGSLFRDSQAYRYYSLTLALFIISGLGVWVVVEILLTQQRSQKQKLRQAKQLEQQLDNQLQTKTDALAEQEQERRTLEQTIQGCEVRLRQQQRVKKENAQKLAELELLLQQQQNQSVATQEEIQQRDKQIARLKEQIATQRQHNQLADDREAQLKSELLDHRQQLHLANQQIVHLTNTIKTVQQKHNQAIAQIQTLEQDLKTARAIVREIEPLKRELKIVQSELENKKLAFENLQQELTNTEAMRVIAFQENQTLQNINQSLEKEKSQLQYQVSFIKTIPTDESMSIDSMQSQGNVIKLNVTEKDLYPGEKYDLIIDILHGSLSYVHENSRRQHILVDILNANPPLGTRDAIETQIRAILKNYKKMTPSTKRSLEALGFQLSQEGKHYKAIFQQDERYTVSLSKTGSDRRGGANLISEIRNRLL
jgi:hypothetical protein